MPDNPQGYSPYLEDWQPWRAEGATQEPRRAPGRPGWIGAQNERLVSGRTLSHHSLNKASISARVSPRVGVPSVASTFSTKSRFFSES